MQSTFMAKLQAYSEKINAARAEFGTYERVKAFVDELSKEMRQDFGLLDIPKAAFPKDMPNTNADTDILA
jgi:hypothetical protein